MGSCHGNRDHTSPAPRPELQFVQEATPGGRNCCLEVAQLHRRELGQTGIKVSVIGLGGVPIVRVSAQEATRVVHAALEQGINFIDTARSYGDSEEKLGHALRGKRSGVVLATKSMARDGDSMARDIARSLTLLATDYIDLYQVHDVRAGDLEPIMARGGALEALLEARRRGQIGHVGLSCHHPDVMIPAIETGAFATIQLPLNIVDYPLFADAIPPAVARNMGIIVMKPLCGGILKSPDLALRFVLSHPVSVAIPGMASVDEVDENASVGVDQAGLKPGEVELLRSEADALGNTFCRRCGYCIPCPAGIEIPDVFRFERYHVSYFAREWAQAQYRALEHRAEACLDCGECEARCPYGLDIRGALLRAHRLLSPADDSSDDAG